jgi:MFS family permease
MRWSRTLRPPHLRGASFGLRQTLDTVGAFVGPALAIALMWLTTNSFRAVFWVAVIPAFLAVGLLLFAVHEPKRATRLRTVLSPLSLVELKRLSSSYWLLVGVAGIFSLARFSEAFLILRAHAVGLPTMLVPLVLVLMNVAYALTAYPAGVLSDRSNRLTILAFGFGLLFAADIVLAFTSSLAGAAVGIALWGVHMGFTQGLLATLVADTAPTELRGTAYGIFNLLSGIALLIASVMAGVLWDRIGLQGPFLAGAGFTALALVGLGIVRRFASGIGLTQVNTQRGRGNR